MGGTGVVVGRAVSSCLVGVSLTFCIGVMGELELPLPLTVSKRHHPSGTQLCHGQRRAGRFSGPQDLLVPPGTTVRWGGPHMCSGVIHLLCDLGQPA